MVKKCNISFVRLGHEQCEACVSAEQHKKISGHTGDEKDCADCSDHSLHLKRASESRSAYREDGDVAKANEAVFAVDLQKVISCLLIHPSLIASTNYSLFYILR